ncbi:MAG: hypothetical protein HYR96_12165 [Deltaproteobacteria bacterium]|nr:hypothetical protein [Deltaproteobacteria bacterium]MBI3294798.1 hypothetical protein [Deltaproteobacteria bacterium]
MNWDVAVEEIGPRLLRYFAATFPRPLAADLVQEVLVRLYQKHESGLFDPERGSLRMFAYGIAHFVRLETLKALPREKYR